MKEGAEKINRVDGRDSRGIQDCLSSGMAILPFFRTPYALVCVLIQQLDVC